MNYEKQEYYRNAIFELSQKLNALKQEAEKDFENFILENGEKKGVLTFT